MADVIVIGGGLSGLVAAHRLEQLNIDYTLIELKRRLGGSIGTHQRDGWTMDTGAFALRDTLDQQWLSSLNLSDALYSLDADKVAFENGTQTLIDALAKSLNAPRLMRMAVSSIGELENGLWGACLENGILLTAKAIIIASPARHTEHMLYSAVPEIAKKLANYAYDSIYRVSLGYHQNDTLNTLPEDESIAFIHHTTHPTRVPDEHVLYQVGIRADESPTLDNLITMGFPANPIISQIDYWANADSLACTKADFASTMQSVHAELPQSLALIGSDYGQRCAHEKGIYDLMPRIQMSLDAVEKIQQVL